MESIKCLIPGCGNHSDEGNFVGEVCRPCYDYLKYKKGKDSQAYRNYLLFFRRQRKITLLKKALQVSQSFISILRTGSAGHSVYVLAMINKDRYDKAFPIINKALEDIKDV